VLPLLEPALGGIADARLSEYWDHRSAGLDAVITQQAQIIAYIDDYKLLMIATLAVLPLLLVLKRRSDGNSGSQVPLLD
jgi:MFS transporter, DHA2 family, multidrug resistance protein